MNKDNKENMRKILKKIGPFLKGSVSTVYKKCGKNCSTCREKGGHPATYLCYRRRGKALVVHIPSSKVDLAKKYRAKYKRLERIIEDFFNFFLHKSPLLNLLENR